MILKIAKCLVSALLFIFVMSCSSNGDANKNLKPLPINPCPSKNNSEIKCFQEPSSPPIGLARVYVFRPDFSDLGINDKPLLVIDDKSKSVLSRLSYTQVDLEIGKHKFMVISGKNDSVKWEIAGEFEIKKDGIYYLSIWNRSVAIDAPPVYKKTDVTEVIAGAVVLTILSGGVVTIPHQGTHNTYNGRFGSQVMYELIEKDDAVEILKQCEYSELIKA